MHCITVHNFKQIRPQSSGLRPKTAQKQPEIVLCAGMKTFEISKLKNYKSDINETWPRYVSPEHLSYTKT